MPKDRAWVGNDVIDLRDPETDPAKLHPRFAARVLAPEELELWRRAGSPPSLLWSFFAAKEAAFKVAVKLRPGIPFAHREFHVHFGAGSVEYDGLTFSLWIEVDDEGVEAVVSTGPLRPGSRRAMLAEGQDSSIACRRMLRQELAGVLDCDPSELTIQREPALERWDGLGPPQLTFRGTAVPLDISLSHHGRFVSASWSGV